MNLTKEQEISLSNAEWSLAFAREQLDRLAEDRKRGKAIPTGPSYEHGTLAFYLDGERRSLAQIIRLTTDLGATA